MKRKEINDKSPQGDGKTKALLTCGVIAGPLFTVLWFIEGATRAGYNPLRHPISSLALSDLGWMQAVNFIITGLLTMSFAIGLGKALKSRGGSFWAPLLFGAIAIGFLGAGFFATDPISGYPPGTPNKHIAYSSTSAALHDLFSALVFLGIPGVCFVFGGHFAKWGEPGWAIFSVVTGITFAVMFVITSMGFAQAKGFVDYGGLFQRITLTIGWFWVTMLAFHLRETSPKGRL